jgi:hypothetical protein
MTLVGAPFWTGAGSGSLTPWPADGAGREDAVPPERRPGRQGLLRLPDGPAVCSGTVIKDVNHPGKSNLVWTAGHCAHAGGNGGWYRNLVFVPAYNDLGKSEAELSIANPAEVAPYGNWWADWASASNQWIQGGSETGGVPGRRTTTPCCT